MSYLDTPHKRKSAIATTIVMVLLLFLIFTFGLKYFDPPLEYGIAVNFGTSNVGSGNIQPTEPLKSASSQEEVIEETQQEEVEETVAETEPISAPSEKVITQDSEESIKIKKQEEAKRKAEEADRQKKLEAERIIKQRKAAEEKKKAEEAAKKKGLDDMMRDLNNSDGNATGGEGEDNQAGDKGQLNGDPYAISYYGNGGGTGTGSGYGLKGRLLNQTGKKILPNCNFKGSYIVVVRIEVDKNGNVIKATPGAKGSTNTDPCLLDPAKKTALSYKWNFDPKAPFKQIGFIVVNYNN